MLKLVSKSSDGKVSTYRLDYAFDFRSYDNKLVYIEHEYLNWEFQRNLSDWTEDVSWGIYRN